MQEVNFEETYIRFYAKMKRFALEYVLREEDAENIIHDVFVELWEQWETHKRHNNVLALLFFMLKNRCIDFLRHKQVQQKLAEKTQNEYYLSLQANCAALSQFNENIGSEEDLHEIINKALASLPDRCREIFVKSKIEGKKQQEIASELNVSIHTVESQMGIAYKKLRKELRDLLPLLFFLLH